MTGQSKEDSGGNRLWCDQWCGARNPGFRKFRRDYAAGATATFLHEDDYSLWQAMNDMDQGGLAHGADAMPAVNAAGYLNAMRRRKRRQAKAFERVYAHQADERIRDLLDALPDNDRRGAAAWALVLHECDMGSNDLITQDIKKEFQDFTIENAVGHHEDGSRTDCTRDRGYHVERG